MNECFDAARKNATKGNSSCKKAIHRAALAFLFFALLSSSGCIGIIGAPKSASGQENTPGAATISVAPGSISFGRVAIGSTVSQSVTISNDGGSNLTITQASATAVGVTLTGISLPLTIGAGKQATFNVIFSPKAAGALSGNLSVMSDVSSSPSTISLSGTGMAATALLTVTTTNLSFGQVVIGKSSALSVALTNAGNSDVTVSKVSVSGAHFSANGVSAGLILAPGQSVTLDATFTPAAPGTSPGSVTVASNAANSPETITLSGDGMLASSRSVEVTWTPSTSAVAGYHVYRSEISGGPYSKLDSNLVAADSFADSRTQAGQTYYYVVTSVTVDGVESPNSSQSSATIPTP